MLLLLLACLRPSPGVGPGPQVDPAASTLRALVLSDSAAVSSLGPDASISMQVKEGEVLRIHAQSSWIPIPPEPEDWDEGYPLYLVHGEGGTGWISGANLAIEQDWQSTGWEGEVPYALQVGQYSWWPAAREGRQWSEKMEGWDRYVTQGWWVRVGPEGTQKVELIDSNGWGSAHSVDRIILRDLTNDGVDEAMLVIHESVTEAGSVGSTLHIFDLTQGVGPLLVLPLNEPHWSGLDTTDRWGWAELDLPRQELRQIYAERTAVEGQSWSKLHLSEQSWTWKGGALEVRGSSTRLPAGQVSGGPTYAEPDLFGEALELQATGQTKGKNTCFGGVSGPVATGDETWFQAVDCQSGAPQFWVPTQRITWSLSNFNEIFGPWPEQAMPPLQVTWR
jgi:hypothetical protein